MSTTEATYTTHLNEWGSLYCTNSTRPALQLRHPDGEGASVSLLDCLLLLPSWTQTNPVSQ